MGNTINMSTGYASSEAIVVKGTSGALVTQNTIVGVAGAEPIQIRESADKTMLMGNIIEAGRTCTDGCAILTYLSPSNTFLVGNVVNGSSVGINLTGSSSTYALDNLLRVTQQKYVSDGTSTNYLIRDSNDYMTGGVGGVVVGSGTKITRHLSNTATWDLPSVNDGSYTSTTLTVTNAAVGDTVLTGFSNAIPAGARLTGAVTSSNTVTVTLYNKSGSAFNLASGTLRADVWQH